MMSNHKIGDIGYEFRKQFHAGWFTGKVVEIRPGAGKSGIKPAMHDVYLSLLQATHDS